MLITKIKKKKERREKREIKKCIPINARGNDVQKFSFGLKELFFFFRKCCSAPQALFAIMLHPFLALYNRQGRLSAVQLRDSCRNVDEFSTKPHVWRPRAPAVYGRNLDSGVPSSHPRATGFCASDWRGVSDHLRSCRFREVW